MRRATFVLQWNRQKLDLFPSSDNDLKLDHLKLESQVIAPKRRAVNYPLNLYKSLVKAGEEKRAFLIRLKSKQSDGSGRSC
jgi:hypothetical protein